MNAGGSGGSGQGMDAGGSGGSSAAGNAGEGGLAGASGAGSGAAAGTSAATACDPLATQSIDVTFTPADVFGAGRDSQGNVYLFRGMGNDLPDLFVGAANAPLSQRNVLGAGSSGAFDDESFLDDAGDMVTVQLDQSGPSGKEMGIATGDVGKMFVIGQVGETLTLLTDAEIGALTGVTTRTYSFAYSAHLTDGRALVVVQIASGPPVEDDSVGAHVYFGTTSALEEGVITYFGGPLSGGSRQIVFSLAGSTYNADMPLTGGGGGQMSVTDASGATTGMYSLDVDATPAAPSGATFLCSGS
jgi:hypothetical protein